MGKMEASGVKSFPLSGASSLLRHVRWEHLFAGVSGGVVSTLVLHPLDLVKIRFQVNEGNSTSRPQYRGILHALQSICRQDGITGLYRGVTPNVWGAGASWGLYFFFYNALKMWMQDGNPQIALNPGYHLLAASEAGFITLIFTNPIWVTKTRLCLQYGTSPTTTGSTNTNYRGMFDALQKIYRFEGIRGLYKGFIPGVFGISHGAIQFMAYEEMKNTYNIHLNRTVDHRLNSAEYITFAALSKMLAAVATYPYQVVRSRLQDQHKQYDGVVDVIKRTWRFEGVRGFYKGVNAYLVHVTPNICIVFLLYEYVTHRYQTNSGTKPKSIDPPTKPPKEKAL